MQNKINLSKQSLILIILVIFWMGVIFIFSCDNGVESTTKSDFALKVLGGFKTPFSIRKFAHMFSYFTLAILIFLASYSIKGSIDLASKHSIIISVIYAMSDEFHQYFVPGRSASLRDVLIDSVGVIIGICLIRLVLKIYSKRKHNQV